MWLSQELVNYSGPAELVITKKEITNWKIYVDISEEVG